MKKLLTTLFILFPHFYVLFGQTLPNSGFENWTGNRPTNWETTNGLMSSPFNNPQTIFQSSDAYAGQFACEIQTKKIHSKPLGVFIPDYAGSMFLGRQISIRSIPGFPYVERPSNLQFFYKYNARNNDSATIYVLLTKWNAQANKKDTLAAKFEIITDSVSTYTLKDIKLTYFDTLNAPDTAIIFITSASSHATNEGAKLIIDELNFKGGTIGIKEQLNPFSFQVFPNPSKGSFKLLFGSNQNIEQIEIRDHLGRKVDFTYQDHTIQLQQHGGLYCLIITTPTGKYTKTIVVE